MFIPRGQKLEITVDGSPIKELGGAPLILDEDITLNISSNFEDLISGGGGTLASTLSSFIKPLREQGLSGQFKQQGFQVWKGTEPIDLSFNCNLHMKTSAKKDVFDPVMALAKFAVPGVAENKVGLIPPGPTIANAIKNLANGFDVSIEAAEDIIGDNVSRGDGTISVSVANYLELSPVIITKAVPIFSSYTDEDGYPIWAKLQIDVRTTDIANKGMLNQMMID